MGLIPWSGLTTLTAGVETPISSGTLNVPELRSSSEDINFCGTQIGAKNEKFLLILSPPKNSVWLPIIGLEARSKVKLIKPVQLILSGESWDFMYCAARFAENCSQPRALLQGRSVVDGEAAANCQKAGVEMAPKECQLCVHCTLCQQLTIHHKRAQCTRATVECM